ncbi:RPTN protein, partial [Podargus strigoides]|nr:RPTN protein [Podargus strigoides]
MSCFLDSISTIISVFHKHAKEDGDCSKLRRRKMKEFILREFEDVIAQPHDPQTIDKILQFLEWDGDGEIDFNEFVLLAFRVAKACYWYTPTGPCLRQKTKLTTSGKTLQEPEIKIRGSRRQIQEEERETCESNHHPSCEAELRRRTRGKERNDARRSEPVRERKIDRQQEVDRESYEHRSRQTWDREEQDVTTNQRETRENGNDGRRQRDSTRYERTRETTVVAAEADVSIQRVSRELESQEDLERRDRPRECREPEGEQRISRRQQREEPVRETRVDRQREVDREVYERRSRQTWDREERGATTNQRETHETVDDGKRKRDSTRYERTRETTVVAAEADVSIQRVSRELEPRDDLERRDRPCECREPEDEQRISRRREREEPVRETRIDRQREVDLEVYERRSRQTRDREERGATTNQRETRETEDDGRRRCESERDQRTRQTTVVAAEADVSIQRVSRELEPRDDLERRDPDVSIQRVSRELETREDPERRERPRECREPEDEQRICRARQREEPVRETRIDHQREVDLEVYERHSRQTRD